MSHGSIVKANAGPYFLYIKKHFCPTCEEKLVRKKIAKIIETSSDEAKSYDLSVSDFYPLGEIKYLEYVFVCNVCNKIYTIKEMKSLGI